MKNPRHQQADVFHEGINRAVQDLQEQINKSNRNIASSSYIMTRVKELEKKLDGAIKDITHIRRFIEVQFPNYEH